MKNNVAVSLLLSLTLAGCGSSGGGDDGGTPSNSAPTITITSSQDFTQSEGASAGDEVSQFTTADADGDALTVTITNSTYYSISGNSVLLTSAGADKVNSGEELPAYTITVSDGDASSKASDDPIVTPSGGFDGVPYDYERYQDALDNANLQVTDNPDQENSSKSDVVDAGEYNDYDSDHFYIDADSGNLTFSMSNYKNRAELRFTENFLTDLDDTQYTLSAELMPIAPETAVKDSDEGEEITLLQVHNKGTTGETDDSVLSHPLVRVVWDGESRSDDATDASYSNAYWAIVKTNAFECSNDEGDNYNDDCPDSYSNFYLGDFTEGEFTKFDLIVRDSHLIINVDDQQQLDYNIDYWSELYSYFKAGVYNQFSNGTSTAEFKSITYSESDYDGNEDGTTPVEGDLDPSAAPSENFDLSTWNLSVPIDSGDGDGYAKATTITVEELNDSYQLNDYFYTDSDDGGMVFRDYIGGARTSEGTSYTRSELREMLRGEDDDIDTKGLSKNNWVFSSVPTSQQKKVGGVDGNMKATLAVNHVTSTGNSSHIGRVIVGQIHAASDEPFRLYYRLLDGHTKGSIYFAHEPNNGNSEQYYEMIGSRSSSASEPDDGIALNEKFSYEIDVVGDLMTVYIMRDGKATLSQEVDMSDSGYNTGYYTDSDGDQQEEYMYFKAGVYNQNNSGETTDYVQATFYSLEKSHGSYED